MANEVKIIVTAHNDTARGFQSARTEVTRWADESAKLYTERMALNLQRFGKQTAPSMIKGGQEMGEALGDSTSTSFSRRFMDRVQEVVQRSRTVFSKVGQDVGNTMGDSISDSISRSVREGVRRGAGGDSSTTVIRRGGNDSSSTNVVHSGGGGGSDKDRDKDRFSFRDFLQQGKDAAAGFVSGFSDRISTFFSGDVVSLVVKSLAIGSLGMALAVPLSAAITAGVGLALGGGAIALGVVGAFKDPRILGAANQLKTKLGQLFEDFGKPFRGPVADFLEKFTSYFLPQLSHFAASVARTFAPLAGDLGNGLIGMLQNLLPGLEKGLDGLAPVVQVLADRLPDIGQALGDFFDKIGSQGDDASVFFNDLITLVIGLITILGSLISAFTAAYANIRNFARNAAAAFLGFVNRVVSYFGRLLDAAYASMSWIPGIGGKLRAAQAQFAQFRANVNAELQAIQNRVVSVTIEYSYRTFGKPYSDVDPYAARGYASGGIKGAASGMISGGLSWVGEHGPELVNLPTGSTVRSHGDSMRMAQGMGTFGGTSAATHIQVSAHPGMEATLAGALMKMLRFEVRRQGGGNVQQALGGSF